MWANGARSPLAPTEPCEGITGWTPLFEHARGAIRSRPGGCRCCRARATGRAAGAWRERLRVASGSPTPMACETIRLRCSCWTSAGLDADIGELAESGRDTVDRPPLGDDPLDVFPRSGLPLVPARQDRATTATAVAGDPDDVRRVSSVPDRDGVASGHAITSCPAMKMRSTGDRAHGVDDIAPVGGIEHQEIRALPGTQPAAISETEDVGRSLLSPR